MELKNLDRLLNASKHGDNLAAIDAIDNLILNENKPGWIKELGKLKAFLTTGRIGIARLAKLMEYHHSSTGSIEHDRYL